MLADARIPERAGQPFLKGAGCVQCHDSGFQGRIGIYEVMEVTPDIRRLVHGMKFAYSGFTLSGSPASGVIDAEDRAAAEAQLRAQQIFVSTLDSSGKTAAPSTTSRSRHVKSRAVKQTSRFMRQLALLATAGPPLVAALAAAACLRRRAGRSGAISPRFAAAPGGPTSWRRTV